MGRKFIEYTETGKAVSDFDVDNEVNRIEASTSCDHFAYSNATVFDEIRARIVEKRLHFTDYAFLFQGETLNINEDGTLNRWPKGFMNKMETQLHRIMDCRMRRFESR